MASFSERLKELREEAGLNQKQLAEVIGNVIDLRKYQYKIHGFAFSTPNSKNVSAI